MALLDNVWYYNFGNGSSTGYYAVTAWSNHTAVAGEVIRQLTTPASTNERCFVCIVAGATGSTEPTWTVTRGAKNVSSSATYQEATGVAALNGDLTNTPNWVAYHAIGTAGTLGQVIKDAAGTHIFIMSTAGTIGGSEPSWNTSAVGNTTVDNGATWTYLGTSFSNWAAPHARFAAVVATNWMAGGNTLYIGDNSAETNAASVGLTVPSTFPTVISTILCVNHSGSVPPVAADVTTGASWSVTGQPTLNGSFYIQGFTYINNSAANNSLIGQTNCLQTWKNCVININATAGSLQFLVNSGGAAGQVTLINTTFGGSGANQGWTPSSGEMNWYNSGPNALSGTVFVTALMGNFGARFYVEGVDFNSYAHSVFAGNVNPGQLTFKDCKIPSGFLGVTANSNQNPPGGLTDWIRSDTGADNYNNYRIRWSGTQATDSTVFRGGGATDGTTSLSWKFVNSTAGTFNNVLFPFVSQPMRIWNNTIGNVTVTLYGTWNQASAPTNNQIWVNVQYYGLASDPDASIATTGLATQLSTAASYSVDVVSSWTNASTTNFSMPITMTINQVGYIFVTVAIAPLPAAANTWIDPKIVLS